MPTSNKLTDERLKEIAALPVTYDDDIPEFSDSDLKGFAPAQSFPKPEKSKMPIKQEISNKFSTGI